MEQQQKRRATRSPLPSQRAVPVDPRTDLPQADIPSNWTMFDALRSCVVHWCGACSLVGGGSHRTEAPVPSSSKPPFAKPVPHDGSGAAADAATSMSYVLVVSDSCVYVLDRSAVVIRCIPIAHIVQLLLVESIALNANVADQCLRGRLDATTASLSVVGFRVDAQTTAREHDLVIGVAVGHAEILSGMLLRIHWSHMGPGAQLPVDILPVPSFLHQAAAARAQQRQPPSPPPAVTTVADVLRGIDDAGIPPMLGLDVTVAPQWALRVEPFRTWDQLREMLDTKQRTLVLEEAAIEGAFRRVKASLTEHMTHEEQQRWRLMARLNEALGVEVASHKRTADVARELLDRLVPNGARLLQDALARPSSTPGETSTPIWDIGHHTHMPRFGNESDGNPSGSATRGHEVVSSLPCTRCRELEYLVESHPNVDKLRILKAEEALLEMEHALKKAEALMMPLRNENAELTQVLHTMMRELVHANAKQEAYVQAGGGHGDRHHQDAGGDAPVGANFAKSFEIGVRNAIRAGEPFYHIRDPDVAPDRQLGATTASTSTFASYADELRGWRLLCAEMERRHRAELKDLYHAFAMYDDIMTESVMRALRHYHPTPDVNLAQATANILAVARQRAQDAKARAQPPAIPTPSASASVAGMVPQHHLTGVVASSPPARQQYWTTLDAFDLRSNDGVGGGHGNARRTAWNDDASVGPPPQRSVGVRDTPPPPPSFDARYAPRTRTPTSATGPFASMVRWAEV